MSIFENYGPFLFPSNEKDMSEEEAQQERKKLQEQLCELMYMQQQYYGIIQEHKYALRGSKLRCRYGTYLAHLDCTKDHGILKDRFPALTVSDCAAENIHNFGWCLCPEANYRGRLPMTVANQYEGIRAIRAPYNIFPHICVPLIDGEHGWKQIDERLLVEVNRRGYVPLLTSNAVLVCQYGGIISIVEVPDVEEEEEEKEKENILYELSAEYKSWLVIAEGCCLYPYLNSNDSETAKKAKTVTIGPGVTFDKYGSNWKAIKEVLEWDEKTIKAIIKGLWEEGKNYSEDKSYHITDVKALELLDKVAEYTYIPNVNRSITVYRQQSGDDSVYSQRELEAMFDYSYNSGLSPDSDSDSDLKNDYSSAINNPNKIMYYYLRHDQKGAVEAVERFGNTGVRRRINQMYLFFIGYEFCDHSDDMLAGHRKALGFDK